MSLGLSLQMKAPRHREVVPLAWGHTAGGAELLLCGVPSLCFPRQPRLPQKGRTPLSVFVCVCTGPWCYVCLVICHGFITWERTRRAMRVVYSTNTKTALPGTNAVDFLVCLMIDVLWFWPNPL